VPDDQDPGALASWLVDPTTPADTIAARLARLSTYQWRALDPIARAMLADRDRRAAPHVADRRRLLDAERLRRGG
jgi:hypothetical protein